MAESVIDSEGRIQIPRGIRERLRLSAGDHVSFRIRGTANSTDATPEIVLRAQPATTSAPLASDDEARRERFLQAMRAVESVPIPADAGRLFWDQFEDPSDYVRAIRAEWEQRLNRSRNEDERVP